MFKKILLLLMMGFGIPVLCLSQNASCGTTYTTNGGSTSFTGTPNNTACTLTVDVGAGNTFTFNDPGDIVSLSGNSSTSLTIVVNSGTLTINGNLEVGGNADFNIQGAGNVVVNGNITFSGSPSSDFAVDGTLDINGDVDLGTNGDLSVSGSGDVNIDGELTVGSSGSVSVDGNLDSTTIDNTAGGTVSDNSGTGTINSGTCTGTCDDVTLPVELVDFSVSYVEEASGVLVQWVTATEINNDFFTIERSSNGTDFEPIGTVSGAGNTAELLNYSFTDYPDFYGFVYYRLKQTDFDGVSETFAIVQVLVDRPEFARIYFSPTITSPAQIIGTPNVWGEINQVNLKLIALNGKTYSVDYEVAEGSVQVLLPQNISSELYVLRGQINGIEIDSRLIVR